MEYGINKHVLKALHALKVEQLSRAWRVRLPIYNTRCNLTMETARQTTRLQHASTDSKSVWQIIGIGCHVMTVSGIVKVARTVALAHASARITSFAFDIHFIQLINVNKLTCVPDMSGAYTYPVYQITSDDARNSQIADLIEDSLDIFIDAKTRFYDEFKDTEYHEKALYDLLEVERMATQMLVRMFRTNLNTLNSSMPQIDVIRYRDKCKIILGIWRAQSGFSVHPFGDGYFVDLVHKPEKWEQHPKFGEEGGSPADWNGIVLSRLSDIHKNISDLFTFAEGRLLSPITRNTSLKTFITNTMLPSTQIIYNQLLVYVRFINAL